MGTVFTETSTKPLPIGTKIMVRRGHRDGSRLVDADVLANPPGLELTKRKAM
jgi:hypothetical protein